MGGVGSYSAWSDVAAFADVLERCDCCCPSPTYRVTPIAEYPSAWTVEAEPEEEDEDEDEDSDNEGAEGPKPPRPPAGATPSQAYAEFLQFLTTGCNGSPIQGYPAILVILSTIPSSVCISPVIGDAY